MCRGRGDGQGGGRKSGRGKREREEGGGGAGEGGRRKHNTGKVVSMVVALLAIDTPLIED